MSGTISGGVTAANTNKKRHGADFYARIGRKGGQVRVPKGFAINRQLASEAGKVGGTRSKRGPAKK